MLSKVQGLEAGIRVGGVEVKKVESVRDLGVKNDCELNMWAHIRKIVSACYYNLRRIWQLRHCPDRDDRQRLVLALVSLSCCSLRRHLWPRDHVTSEDSYRKSVSHQSCQPCSFFFFFLTQFLCQAICPKQELIPLGHSDGHCSARSTLAPNPWENIIQGVSHDVQHRQRNSADIHDWHGHAYLRSSSSVARCHLRSAAEGLFDVLRTQTVFGSRVYSIADLVAWNGLEWSSCPCSSHSFIPLKSALKTHYPTLISCNSSIIFVDYLCILFISFKLD